MMFNDSPDFTLCVETEPEFEEVFEFELCEALPPTLMTCPGTPCCYLDYYFV